MNENKKAEIVSHPNDEERKILITEQPDGQRIAFEVDQAGK